MKTLFSYKKNTNIRAFTLLEVLAATSIVTMVILGPFTAAVTSSSYSKQTKDVMISTYLAEEAIELIRYQYTSLYVASISGENIETNLTNENDSEKAWRLFKTRMNGGLVGLEVNSCFSIDGCAFDFIDMASTTSANDDLLQSTTGCPKIDVVSTSSRKYYVCKGIDPTRIKGGSSGQETTAYARKINILSKTTFESDPTPGNPNDPKLDLYHDDLLITITVSFRRSNGTMRDIVFTDFLHPRT